MLCPWKCTQSVEFIYLKCGDFLAHLGSSIVHFIGHPGLIEFLLLWMYALYPFEICLLRHKPCVQCELTFFCCVHVAFSQSIS